MAKVLSNTELANIADEFGTPVYVYDADKIKSNTVSLQQHLEILTPFFYACKALTNINILRYIKSLGANVDCSSINEVRLALHAGFAAESILYTSNGIAFNEIEEAKDLGVIINIDSLSNLEKFGKNSDITIP